MMKPSILHFNYSIHYYYNHYTNTAVEYVGSLAHGLKPLSGMYQPAVHAYGHLWLRLKVPDDSAIHSQYAFKTKRLRVKSGPWKGKKRKT